MDLTNPERILVVQIGKIGDMILTAPLFYELKRLFPLAKLTVLASKINKDIPLNNTFVDEVIIYKKNLLLFPKSSLKNTDLWIDTKDNYSKTSGLLVKLFKPKLSLGFNFDKKIFDISLNEFIKGTHAADKNLTPVIYFERNFPFIKSQLVFNLKASLKNKASGQTKSDSARKILINISAGTPSRYLSKDLWIDTIKKINSIELSSITLIGLRKDSKLINSVLDGLENVKITFSKTRRITDTFEIVAQSDIVISADTSIVHVCSAFNIPVIGLYPDVKWNFEKFAPLSSFNEVIISKNKNSLEGIEAGEIADAYMRLIKKITGGNAESRTRVRKEDH